LTEIDLHLLYCRFLIKFSIGLSFRGGRRSKRGRRDDRRTPKKLHRTNLEIRATEVRVVDEDGELVGVMGLSEALVKAREADADLVEISPQAKPPVCKIVDYGKMLYALSKKDQQAKKANKPHEMKGIRITFRIGPADLERQGDHAKEFLKDGHPVKVQLVMRGREKAHKGLALEKMKQFLDGFADVATVDQVPRTAGHQIVAILKPTKSS